MFRLTTIWGVGLRFQSIYYTCRNNQVFTKPLPYSQRCWSATCSTPELYHFVYIRALYPSANTNSKGNDLFRSMFTHICPNVAQTNSIEAVSDELTISGWPYEMVFCLVLKTSYVFLLSLACIEIAGISSWWSTILNPELPSACNVSRFHGFLCSIFLTFMMPECHWVHRRMIDPKWIKNAPVGSGEHHYINCLHPTIFVRELNQI